MKKENKIQIIVEEVVKFFSDCEEVFSVDTEIKMLTLDNAINSLANASTTENELRLVCQEWLSDQEYKLGGFKNEREKVICNNSGLYYDSHVAVIKSNRRDGCGRG